MNGSNFARSLGFAVLSGLAVVPWQLVVAPLLGREVSFALFAVAALLLYTLTIASSWREGARATALCATILVFGAAVLGLSGTVHSLAVLVIGGAAALGVMRSGMLHRSTPARSLLIEVALLGVGLAFAGKLAAGRGALDMGLTIWGFFLVQSVFFLLGDRRHAERPEPEVDPFERAARRMEEILSS